MSFVALLVVLTSASVIAALALDRGRRRWRLALRIGFSLALAAAGMLNLWRLGLRGVEASCADLVGCLVVSPFADACYQLLNAALILPRSCAPVTGWIVFLEMAWRIVSRDADPLVPLAFVHGGLGDRVFEASIAAWALYVGGSLPAAGAAVRRRFGGEARQTPASPPIQPDRSEDQ